MYASVFDEDIQNLPFSTYDQDNDGSSINCAVRYNSGWWFSNCFSVVLNGVYSDIPKVNQYQGINWWRFRGNRESLKETKMMVRRS